MGWMDDVGPCDNAPERALHLPGEDEQCGMDGVSGSDARLGIDG